MSEASGIGIFTSIIFAIVAVTYVIIYNLHKNDSISDDTCSFMKLVCSVLFLLLGVIFLSLDIFKRSQGNKGSLYGINIYTVLSIVSLTMGIVYKIDDKCSVLHPQK